MRQIGAIRKPEQMTASSSARSRWRSEDHSRGAPCEQRTPEMQVAL